MSIRAGKSRSKSLTLFPALNYYRGVEWHANERTLSIRFLRYYIALHWG